MSTRNSRNWPRKISGQGAVVVFMSGMVLGCLGLSRADDWPQWRGPRRDGVWRETGVVDRFAGPTLEAKWRVPVGPGYSGPTVADGRVYLTDRVKQPVEQERILCFDAKTGATLWTRAYDCRYGKIGYQAGPRAGVTVAEGRAYSIGATGHTFCVNATDGQVIWERDLQRDYQIEMPIWGIAAAPLLFQDLVILHIGGTPQSCIVALDRQTGKQRWSALGDRGQYASPILVEQAGKPVVICWTGDAVVGLNPTDGKVYWRYDWKPRNMPIGVATPIVDRNRVFFTSFYDGSLLLELSQQEPKFQKVWQRVGANEQRTDALHSIISTPLFLGDHIYGVDSYGELRCLDAATGERVWENLTATPKARWSTIHFVVNGDRVWMFNERGELIIARLSPQGYEELSRAKLLTPTLDQLNSRNGVCWSHPAFANRCVFARNDQELVCADLAKAVKE